MLHWSVLPVATLRCRGMAGGQVISTDEEQRQQQGQAKRKRDCDTAQREGHLLSSPFAYTHRPEFADKGQAFAKHLAARASLQEEGSTAYFDNMPHSSSLGPASPGVPLRFAFCCCLAHIEEAYLSEVMCYSCWGAAAGN